MLTEWFGENRLWEKLMNKFDQIEMIDRNPN